MEDIEESEKIPPIKRKEAPKELERPQKKVKEELSSKDEDGFMDWIKTKKVLVSTPK